MQGITRIITGSYRRSSRLFPHARSSSAAAAVPAPNIPEAFTSHHIILSEQIRWHQQRVSLLQDLAKYTACGLVIEAFYGFLILANSLPMLTSTLLAIGIPIATLTGVLGLWMFGEHYAKGQRRYERLRMDVANFNQNRLAIEHAAGHLMSFPFTVFTRWANFPLATRFAQISRKLRDEIALPPQGTEFEMATLAFETTNLANHARGLLALLQTIEQLSNNDGLRQDVTVLAAKPPSPGQDDLYGVGLFNDLGIITRRHMGDSISGR